jgi:stage V sporulation protein AF
MSRRLGKNMELLTQTMGIGESFDLWERRLKIAQKDAALIWVDGLINDLALQRVIESLLKLKQGDLAPNPAERLMKEYLNYAEAKEVDTYDDLITEVLAGQVAILVDGDSHAVMVDVREYPGREPDEPDLERVVRGSRDGMVETLVLNTVLIRRRLRDPSFRAEAIRVGRRSKTDVAVIYLKDVCNLDLVKRVKDQIARIQTDAIPMAEKTVEEFLVGPWGWWNPFPRVRFTERPDVAAVHLLEGHVIVLVDTSPSVIILPATLFHHVQHAEEYRENTLVGVYIRWVRFLGIALSLVGPPLWVALALRPELLPEALDFIGPRREGNIPLLAQFFIAEVGVDLIRIALVHTPAALGTALGFIGAILLGQIAISVGLLASETILYVAVAALGTFGTPSLEFALAVKLSRLALLGAVGVFGILGLAGGLLALTVLLGFTRSFGVPYLWPLIPFDWAGLKSVLVRRPIPVDTGRPSALKPQEPDKAPRDS